MFVVARNLTALPPLPARMPQASLGSSDVAWANISWTSVRPSSSKRLPPELLLSRLVVAAGPQLAAQVLPAAIGQQADNVAPVEALAVAQGGVDHRPAGYPGENALVARQP